jgi:hypothetical protein
VPNMCQNVMTKDRKTCVHTFNIVRNCSSKEIGRATGSLTGEGRPNVKASEEDGYQGRSRRRAAEGDGIGRAPR